MMEAEHNHLNHTTCECKYNVVSTPNYRKKLPSGKIKRHLGQVFHHLHEGTSAGSEGFVQCGIMSMLISPINRPNIS
jgi:putative transposase